ncbi:MAG: double zinc ribbon domain-containing protein [Patescibacteria group bacterium]|jgi:competence protein ComFC|nr:double zinc ribbon domain-containing protein [Patescibacteria group bacterium]
MLSRALNTAKNYVTIWRNFLLDLIFPIECLSCSIESKWICNNCYKDIIIKQTQQCLSCGKNNLLGSFCKKCKNNNFLDGVLVASNYDDKLLSQAIKSYKYKLVKGLSIPLSQLLIDLLTQILEDPEKNYFWHGSQKNIINNFTKNIVIPVPLHKKRFRWRGFNQSEELAKIVAEHFKLRINAENLKRIIFKKPQTALDKDERFNNIKNSFIWNGSEIDKKNIILIDDVSTSTATLNECAKVLKKAGANKVWGLVIAHG